KASTASAERFQVQVVVSKSTHDKLRRAQALLSHAVPNGDVAQVLDRALDSLIAQLERRKVGAARSVARQPNRAPATAPTRPAARAGRARYIPAQTRRTVWDRDGGRCTFVSADGHRCSEDRFLEFDHVEPLARGGATTVDRLRLRCRAHNQYEAERAF